MAIVSDFSLPLSRPRGRGAIHVIARLGASIATPLYRRWIYQRTLAALEHYSARTLEDIGANRGREEFARRAAGL